jgi:hypothetical protein
LAGKRAPETAFVGDTDSGDRQGAISHFPDPYHFNSEILSAAPFAEMMGQTTANNKEPCLDQKRVLLGFSQSKMIKTHIKHVRGLTKKDQTFASASFHRFLP